MDNINQRIENYKFLLLEKEKIQKAADLIKQALFLDNKILFCGNGGSASDSNHYAAEFVGKFQKERKSLSAISLCANNSTITAIANDYSYNNIFTRQIEGLGKKNDVLIALSTSGKSENVIKAIKTANKMGLITIFLVGKEKIEVDSTLQINAPSAITAQIQEMHTSIIHIILEILNL